MLLLLKPGGRSRVRAVTCALALSWLSACESSGGSHSPAPAPTPTNRAPTFTSGTTATLVENEAGSFYQSAATDPDGGHLVYSIVGGADAARFEMTAGGALRFSTAPNYDLPGDANGDNVYRVEIRASDGSLSATQALDVSVTNSKEGVSVRRIATGFNDPVAVSAVSETLLLVAERTGTVYTLDTQSGTKRLLHQFAQSDIHIRALVAAPDYLNRPAFYVIFTSGGFVSLGRYVANATGPGAALDTSGPIIGQSAPGYAGGGWLGFDSDGVLLAAFGDADSEGDPANAAQTPGTILGKLVQIIRNPDPYAGASVRFFVASELARGLHWPLGGSFVNGDLLFGDRGQDAYEEINRYRRGALRNYGWPAKEGTQVVRGSAPADALDPVAQYPHGSDARAGNAVIGGARGPSTVPSLQDSYVFADAGGAIFTLPLEAFAGGSPVMAQSFERRDADFAPDAGSINAPAAIAPGPDGTLYILDFDGELFRVDAG